MTGTLILVQTFQERGLDLTLLSVLTMHILLFEMIRTSFFYLMSVWVVVRVRVRSWSC